MMKTTMKRYSLQLHGIEEPKKNYAQASGTSHLCVYINFFSFCLSVCLSRFCYHGNTPLYLSQKWRYWHETFRILSLGSTKSRMILCSKSCQELSMSSKNPHEGPPILHTLLIKISTRNFQGIFIGVKQGYSWHHVIQVSYQEPSTSFKYPH